MIDRTRLAELSEEVGADDLCEVVDLFCEEVEETLSRVARHGTATLAEDLHFLKGSALNIGMSEVAELCRRAETAVRADPDAAPDFAKIAQAFKVARHALNLEIGLQS